MAIIPKNPRAHNWPRERRYESAVKYVVEKGWSRHQAAEWYGVDRKTLGRRVDKFFEKKNGPAEDVLEAASSPLGLQEKVRIPDDPVEFQQTYFGHISCPNHKCVHPMPEFHKEIAILLAGSESALVNVPPGHAKTTVGTVRSSVYDIAHDRNKRIIIVSQTLPFAKKLLVPIVQLLTDPEVYRGAKRNLIEDAGLFKPEERGGAWNTNQIYVTGRQGVEKDPTVQVLGVGQQIYGARADKIVCDDIATLDNQRNPERVVEQMEWINKELASRVGPDDPVFFIGTRIKPDDIYAQIQATWGDELQVIKYPCILDEDGQATLWQDHFDYETAAKRRSRMAPQDWELVYQQVEIPGVGMSFPRDVVEECLDYERPLGHFERHWILVAGLDPAGAGPESGYTAFTLWGLDRETGMRYLVDLEHVQQMKAPALRDFILGWSDTYPIAEWRVEGNGMQRNLVQYNDEITRGLAAKGTRVVTHITRATGQGGKWDAVFGVDTMAPLYHQRMVSIPYAGLSTQMKVNAFLTELYAFPLGSVNDLVMSSWFAELGLRERSRKVQLPHYREEKRWPGRIKRRRKIVDFQNRQVINLTPGDQTRRYFNPDGVSRRLVQGRPGDFREDIGAQPPRPVNVEN